MENDVFFFVVDSIKHYIIAAVKSQIARNMFAQRLQNEKKT